MADEIGIARWLNDPRMTEAASLLAFQKGLTLLADKLESVAALYQAASTARFRMSSYGTPGDASRVMCPEPRLTMYSAYLKTNGAICSNWFVFAAR